MNTNLPEQQLSVSDIVRLILETPIIRNREPYRGELEDEIEVDDGRATLESAAARVTAAFNRPTKAEGC